MKKSRLHRWRQLLRKTPLARRSSQLKKTPLKKVSDGKQGWLRKYERAKARCTGDMFCAKCWDVRHRNGLEPHHPYARVGERILSFVWVCPRCHSEIHDHGELSKEQGWLQPEFYGRPHDPKVPRPWPRQQEIDHQWPYPPGNSYLQK